MWGTPLGRCQLPWMALHSSRECLLPIAADMSWNVLLGWSQDGAAEAVSAWQAATTADILYSMRPNADRTVSCASVQERENEEPFKSLTEAQQRQALVKELHLLKTDLFMKMVEDGMMPLRPGVKRLVSAPPLSRTINTPAPWRREGGLCVKPGRQRRCPDHVLNVPLVRPVQSDHSGGSTCGSELALLLKPSTFFPFRCTWGRWMRPDRQRRYPDHM